ncbi:hypothetical protein D3C71_2003260 [compost metagenome]
MPISVIARAAKMKIEPSPPVIRVGSRNENRPISTVVRIRISRRPKRSASLPAIGMKMPKTMEPMICTSSASRNGIFRTLTL